MVAVSAEITNYDEECGSDVIIPSTIDGKKVIGIANERSGIPVTKLNNSIYESAKFKKIFNSKTYRIVPLTEEEYSVFEELDITSVKFPNTLIYIGYEAFKNCSLTKIEFPNSIRSIMIGAFAYNNITDVVIPKSVVSIGERAFYRNPLVNVEVKGSPTIDWEVFYTGSGNNSISIFKYGRTCEEMNNLYSDTGMLGSTCTTWQPNQIIASDGGCEFINNHGCPS